MTATSPMLRATSPLTMAALVLGMLLLSGCSEPDTSVTRSTSDEQFELRLEARKNHLKSEESLPVWVEVERLAGRPASSFRGTVDFVTNQGSVSPNRLDFTLIGQDDSVSVGPTTIYGEWVTFTLSRSPADGRQAELHALFNDLDAILKIRIVEE
ncbi:MAG: hypothetical protein HN712_24240 [Gemmatimonadetes bacterium]|jgi:hypothetical protein|nr:hypothetical protein [Gemmatimonadota bacterium]MBT6147034.1 hypothetical protein [Gemmatimonadota bacterium]MBT7863447.1 hypothetical protein [Gemmatimonadota bacterium]